MKGTEVYDVSIKAKRKDKNACSLRITFTDIFTKNTEQESQSLSLTFVTLVFSLQTKSAVRVQRETLTLSLHNGEGKTA